MTDTRLPMILISKRSLFLKYLICIGAIAVDYRAIVGTVRVRYHDFMGSEMPWYSARTRSTSEQTTIGYFSESGHSQQKWNVA